MCSSVLSMIEIETFHKFTYRFDNGIGNKYLFYLLRVGGSGGVAGEGLSEGSPVVKVLGLPHISRAPTALNGFLFNFLEKKLGGVRQKTKQMGSFGGNSIAFSNIWNYK